MIPVLPTVPLLIITASLFSRSSPRWHAWLLARPRLGPPLRDWEGHGIIAMRTKIATTVIMSVFLAYPVLFSGLPAFVRIFSALMALTVFGFLWSRPSRSRIT